MKEDRLNSLFGNLLSRNAHQQQPGSPEPTRVVAVMIGIGVDRFSGAIAPFGSTLPEIGWLVETMHPILLASIADDADIRNRCLGLINACNSRSDVRLALAIGSVNYGAIGSGIRTAYGSTGALITDMLDALLASKGGVLVNGELLKRLGAEAGCESIQIREQSFVQWTGQLS